MMLHGSVGDTHPLAELLKLHKKIRIGRQLEVEASKSVEKSGKVSTDPQNADTVE